MLEKDSARNIGAHRDSAMDRQHHSSGGLKRNLNVPPQVDAISVKDPVIIFKVDSQVLSQDSGSPHLPEGYQSQNISSRRSRSLIKRHDARINAVAVRKYRKPMGEVLQKFALQGLTDAETGVRLGVSKETASSYYRRFDIDRPSVGERRKIRARIMRKKREIKRKKVAILRYHRARRDNEITRAFGDVEEKQRYNFERMYASSGSLKKMSISLREQGISLSVAVLSRLRTRLDPVLPRKDNYGAKIKDENKKLVADAIKEGWLEYLSPNQLEVIIKRYPQDREAYSIREIAEFMNGITRAAVSVFEQRALAKFRKLKNGEMLNKSGGRRIDLDDGLICKMYNSGDSMQKIGDHFGASAFLIRSRLIENKQPIRPRSGRKKSSGVVK